MTVKRLYLAHHHTSAPEVHVLADELRVHGVAPWVDKEGGFKIGDHSPDEARRTIREDCSCTPRDRHLTAISSGTLRLVRHYANASGMRISRSSQCRGTCLSLTFAI